MRDLAALTIHLLVTIARLLGLGGARSVIAESLLIKHQLLILNRSRTRALALHPADRIFAGLASILMHPTRLMRSSIVLKPSTMLRFHKALVKRKIAIVGICVVVVYISYPPLRELYFAPDRIID